MKDKIQIMSLTSGHDEWNFDPENKDDVKSIKKKMRKLFDDGFYAYAFDKETRTYRTLQPSKLKSISDEALTEFIMVKDKKKIVQMPVTGG